MEKKLVLAIFIVAAIAGIGYLILSGNNGDFLKKSSAMAVKSWGAVFGGSVKEIASEDLNGDIPLMAASSSDWEAPDSSLPALIPKASAKTRKAKTVSSSTASKAKKSSAKTKTAKPAVQIALEDSSFPADDGGSFAMDETGQTACDELTAAAENVCPSSSDSASDLAVTPASSAKKRQDVLWCSAAELPPDLPDPQSVIFNEVAWMGSVPKDGESGSKASSREWIELKNKSDKAANLGGWQVVDGLGNIKISFGPEDSIAPGGFYLLSRNGAAVDGSSPDKAYSGALSNSRSLLALFDPDCEAADFVDALKGWPGGNNKTKQTLERKIGGTGSTALAAGWQTSLSPGGTPKRENSSGAIISVAPASQANPMPVIQPSSSPIAPISSTVPAIAPRYTVSVAIQGDGMGTIISKPAGISCNSTGIISGTSVCSAEYPSGTALILTPTGGKGTLFRGWSGACSGLGSCSFVVGGTASLVATFNNGLDVSLDPVLADAAPRAGVPPPLASITDSAATSSVPAGLDHLVIAQVQIAGSATANDFVKIYNPTPNAIDVSGWKLRKKSGSGTDYSLRTFGGGTSIAPGNYFTWANSSGGFAQSINADASSSETLAADNSVALLDAAGAVVDAVAWGNGSSQYVEGTPYPTNPAANQILQRRSAGGALVDTDNNAGDFEIK